MGVMSGEDLGDARVQAMAQGPFCRVCLKRLLPRARVNPEEIPGQWGHCGLTWTNQESDSLSIFLFDLKRKVYDDLDREFSKLKSSMLGVHIGEEMPRCCGESYRGHAELVWV